MSQDTNLKYVAQDAVHYSAADDPSVLGETTERHRRQDSYDQRENLNSTSSDVIHSANDNAHSSSPQTSMTVSEAVEHIGMGPFQILIIVICGLFTFADAMEMLLLAVLGPILQCEWLLGEFYVAFITTIVFIGYMVMAPVWGGLSDHYGRKNTLIVVCLWIAFYGFLTAFSPTYGWVLILRGMVGAGIAGASQAFVLTSEYIPSVWRARLLVASGIFWTFGSLFEIGIAAAIVPNIPRDAAIPGWRVLVLVSSLPTALVALTMKWLPESARFLVAAGRDAEAKEVLDAACKMNKAPKLPYALKPEPAVTRGHIRDLFNSTTMTLSTLACWLLWFTAAFSYYGMILLSAVLMEHEECNGEAESALVTGNDAGGSNAGTVCSCAPPSNETYVSMLLSTFGEFASIWLNFVTLDRFGRKKSMAFYLGLQGVVFFLLIPCGLPNWLITTLTFIIRGVSASFFNAVYSKFNSINIFTFY